MSDLPGALEFFDQDEVKWQGAISEPLATKIGNNINKLIDKQAEDYPLGGVFYAYLTEAQVQSQLGTNFVLCDGRDVTGSDYDTLLSQTTIPDNRGYFIRGNDPGGGVDEDAPRTVASTQQDQVEDHIHKLINGTDANNIGIALGPNAVMGTAIVGTGGAGPASQSVLASGASNTVNSTEGVAESRPQNIAFNSFIKINN